MQKSQSSSKINVYITINPPNVSNKWVKRKNPIKKPIDTLPVMGYEVNLTPDIDE